MNILQPIFTDYYEPIIYKLHPRPSVIENVNKMIHCGDPSHGGAMYGCPHFRKVLHEQLTSRIGPSFRKVKLVLEVYHKKTALFEQYRKVMKYG